MGSEHGLMGLPKDEVRSGLDSCRDCHSSGRPNFQISYSVTNDIFDRHHGEGDEYRRSPHKNLGCTACHDPHKSIWKKEGGLKGIDEHDEVALGNMCVRCHNGRPLANGIVLRAMKLRGAHGEMGLLCMDCHMQENSAGGHRRTHLWKVNTAPLAADDNVSGGYWKNEDGTLGWSLEPGVAEASLTLDLVCTRCHQNRTVQQLSSGAKYIHRQPGLVDLTVNGGDSLQIVKKTTPVSVDFAVYPEELGAGPAPAADWYVLQQKPRGWSYWNGTKWRGGLKPWQKNTPVADVTQNVLNAPLKKPGNYTFWMLLDIPTGEELGDSVPVYVSKR